MIETIHPRKGTETKADALKDVRRYETIHPRKGTETYSVFKSPPENDETIHPRKGTETIGRQLIETEAE